MTMKPYQEKIIQLYETQERQLAELYSAFSDRFETDRVFWRELAAEEAKHAEIVAKLYSAVEKGGVLFDEGKVKTYTLAKMIEHTEALLDQARRGAMDRIVALSQAVDLESSLIEKGVFSHFEALTDKAQAVLKRLNRETMDHVTLVRRVRDGARDALQGPAPAGDRLVWTETLSVNDPRLDGQHRLLFALINDLADLESEKPPHDDLLGIIKRLIAFSDVHFGTEDDIMIASDFPLFASHRQEHQQFLTQIRRFVEDFATGRRQLSAEVTAFLKDWWFRHTAEADQKYARWIRNRQQG